MSFLAPAAFALGLLLPLVVAMYLLRLRRTEQVVSSVYLWRRMVRDVEANAPWQRLQRNLLLLLQLLFLAVLIFALARPFTWSEGASGQSVILILDNSASMTAVDVAPTRLEAAKDQAQQLVDGLPEDARITVIAAGQEAQVKAASSQDRRQVLLAIESITASTGRSELGMALELASAIAARQPDTEIVVLSDGRAALPPRLALKGRLRYLPIGLSGENQAVSLLTLEAPTAGGRATAFAQVTNYGASPARRRLNLYADGQLVNVFDLEIAPGEQRAVLAEDLPMETRLVEAQLAPPEGAAADAAPLDVLPLDDRALAVRRSQEPAQVVLVSPGNLFLETALSLLPGIEVSQLDPADAAGLTEADLTILDGVVPLGQASAGPPEESQEEAGADPEPTPTALPAAALPSGNLLFIAPPRSTAYFSTTGALSRPTLRPVDAADPLLNHISLAGVSVMDGVRIPLPDWARIVVAGDVAEGTYPLLFAGEVDGRRVAVLAFDLHHSDLPLQVSFPLLWANLIGWLAPGAAGEVPAQLTPGDSFSLSLSPEVESVTVIRPDRSSTRLALENGRVVIGDTAALGLYEIHWGEDEGAAFVVNPFLPQESDLQPVDALPGVTAVGEGAGSSLEQARREWWRPLALLALGLLMGEWMVYQRAALARLAAALQRRWAVRLRPGRPSSRES